VLDERRHKVAIQMTQVQRAFFFNITHELRTPLNSIIGFNTLATESGELTEFTESFIKASLTSAEALLGLINQILDFAKFEGAKDKSGGSKSSIELSEDVWTLRQLIEQVTDMSQKASSRGVDLVINIASPEHFNTKFVGDFFRLRQCCVNLVDNAIKYSSNIQGRTALVEFTMKVRTNDDQSLSSITFIVEDNGVGIPAAKQHALFVPFCQPADHKTAKEKGTGLGLVITKSIIECMGGDIDFESVEDEWTKFFFTLDFPRLKEKSSSRRSSVDAGYQRARAGYVDPEVGSLTQLNPVDP
jgi:signal transduction histidine kinase